MTNYLVAGFLGVFFGFSLNKAGLTKYHKIGCFASFSPRPSAAP